MIAWEATSHCSLLKEFPGLFEEKYVMACRRCVSVERPDLKLRLLTQRLELICMPVCTCSRFQFRGRFLMMITHKKINNSKINK